MTRVVIIGGTGHVGTYLVPRMVAAGFEVVNVSRGARQPYRPHAAWKSVRTVTLDRDVLEASGSFGGEIRALDPDIVIDMICFTAGERAGSLVDALAGHVRHFLHCGTIWVHGPSVSVPTTEEAAAPAVRRPTASRKPRSRPISSTPRAGPAFPPTIIHPGHIVGPGWAPLNPAGHFDPAVFSLLAQGGELALPNLGMETVHHVHADDVAQAFVAAIESRQRGARRGVPRRFAGRPHPARLCRGDGGVVRPGGES